MTTKYGVFMEPSYLGPGSARPKEDSKKEGKGDVSTKPAIAAFHIPSSKYGKANDATFSPFSSLHDHDPYRPRLPRAERIGPAFKPAGQAEKGPLSSSDAANQPPPAEPPKKKGDVVHEKRQMMTNPAKKGGFGFNMTTLSQRQGAKGVAGEYEYHRSAAAQGADAEAAAPKEQFKPFFSAVRGKQTVSGALTDYGWQPRPAAAAAVAKVSAEKVAPFRAGTGRNRPFSKYPEHLPPRAAPQGKAGGDSAPAAEQATARRAWIHTASNHSGAIRSIVRMNI